jgi:hypothetical protein
MARLIALTLILCAGLSAQTWTLAANAHFEVYAQAGEDRARAILAWLERLRALLARQLDATPDRLRPARVIAFASAADYAPYRLTASADAYYIGTEGRDYIVLSDGPRAPGNAAHEYAHMALHSSGIDVPRWLSEGLSELFSALGADRPDHSAALRRAPWLPLPDLLRLGDPGPAPGVYYAESWALTDMLAFAPAYSGKLRALVGALAAMPPEAAFASIYGRTPAEATADLRSWIERRKTAAPIRVGPVAGEDPTTVSKLPPARARILLAQMLLDAGQTARAEQQFRALPDGIGDVEAALGLIALLKGDPAEARERWTRALELGVTDDALCYRYAALAPDADVRPVLARAVALRPDFDDALYNLALLEKNAGEAQALDHLRAMRPPGPSRAFPYWCAISDALNTLSRHDEAEAAARTAASHAVTPAERAQAAQLAWLARTELTVQLVRGQMVTARVPRRTADWNPFVEPQDDARTVEGALVEIDCEGPMTRVVVETGDTRLRLVISDPSRVQMKNAPSEFTCGPQSSARVRVVYAARRNAGDDGIVRGMDFR